MAMLPNAYAIGRTLPDFPLTGLIHAAAPNHKNRGTVLRFHEFNIAVHEYLSRFQLQRVVVVGSWWQHADGECRQLLYTRLKDHQRRVFDATHVVPFSIYGDDARPGRGFIPQLVEAIKRTQPLAGLSDQPRDFVHVSDVARACLIALDVPRGTYIAATQQPITPRDLAARYGVSAPDYREFPSAVPNYIAQPVPAWEPLVTLDEHIQARTALSVPRGST